MTPTFRPTIIVQLDTREKVGAFQHGLGETERVVALGMSPTMFRTLPGLDAVYFSLTQAEQWGSRPLPPHVAALLQTSDMDRRSGMPKYVVTGLVLRENDPNTVEYCVPLILKAVQAVVDDTNTKKPGEIRTVGFFEFELEFKGASMEDVGRSFAEMVR